LGLGYTYQADTCVATCIGHIKSVDMRVSCNYAWDPAQVIKIQFVNIQGVEKLPVAVRR